MGENHIKKEPRLRLRITAAAEKHVRSGHPWVFESSVLDLNRPGRTGELAVIYDRNNKFLAIGLFDERSPIRVRILHSGAPQTIDPQWWKAHFDAAVSKRDGLFDAATTGFRLINGENDGWPGMVLDKYGECLVLKLYAASWLPRAEEIVRLVDDRCLPVQLVLRLSRNVQEEAKAFGLTDGQLLKGLLPNPSVTFLESGLRFEAEVVRGQKTGFFLDQRENRRTVEKLARSCAVLNAFSFSGAFSAYAARGGATSVTDLDISAHALDSSRRNHQLNIADPQVARCKREWVQADVFEWLEKEQEKTFDLIILDPPSLARRESEREGAVKAYSRLARLGAKRLNKRGLLLCCSCSAHVSSDEFFQAALKGASTSGNFKELQRTGHAPDHKATFAEGEYLKAIYLRQVSG